MNFAVVDLESSSLRSDTGYIICGGIKPIGGEKVCIGLADVKRPKDVLAIDSHLVRALRDEMLKYDGWITWNGKMFDLPLLNDRLMFAGERPIERRFHLDIMYYFRQGQSRITSSRLDWVAKALGVPVSKTALDLKTWMRAGAEAIRNFRDGRENYDYIIEHNLADLDVTEAVYPFAKPRIRNIHF